MDDTASIVVSPIVDMLVHEITNMAKKKIDLIKGLDKDIEQLKSNLSTIRSVLEDAQSKQMDSKPVKDWLGKLEDAAYDAKDILDTHDTEVILWEKKQQVRKVRLPFSASKNSFKLNTASHIKEILKTIDKIEKEKDGLHLKSESTNGTAENRITTSPENRITTSLLHATDVVGRAVDRDQIIDLLISEKYDREGYVAVLPIIGAGGLGKTTLAQYVYNDVRVKSHFGEDSRIWVCVTENYDPKRIVKEMIEHYSKINSDINSISLEQLESRFRERFEGNRFLLVLDDVWNEEYEEWDKLKRLLVLGGKGSRVLVTTRSLKVSNVMQTLPPYELDHLSEEQCRSLFEKIVFEEPNVAADVRTSLRDIGTEIVGKCERLPLAVKAMAGLLRGKVDRTEWNRILEHVGKAEEGKVLPVLKLSYDHLPSHLKQCFAYCSMFPKAYVFDKMELVKVWKAQSFIRSDQIGIQYFDELLNRYFFQVSNSTDNNPRYRMHDFIHDLAQFVSNPRCCQVKDNECNVTDRSRHVALLCSNAKQSALEGFGKSKKRYRMQALIHCFQVKDKEPSGVSDRSQHVPLQFTSVEDAALKVIGKSRKLHTLLSPVEHLKFFGKALDKIFHTTKYIRVLDLNSCIMLELPESVKELKLLCYLDLSKTEIRKLPDSICSLYHLQTLKLLGCLWLFELPNDLGNLTNLQHLELDEMFWYKSSKLPPRLGNLTNLQNLHAFHVGQESGYGIDELKGMKYLKGKLHISKLENAVNAEGANLKEKEGLEKVVFEWSNRDGHPQDEAADERMLEDLQPHSNLKDLQIFHYRGTRFPSWMGDGLFQNLVTISISHCIKCKVLSLGELPHLGKLYIKGMQELEEWPEGQYHSLYRLKVSSCPKLKKLPQIFLNLGVLKIKRCDSLRELPVSPSLQLLTLVDNLVLEDWNEEIELFPFSELLELKIINCPKLQALPVYLALQKLEISGCPLLCTLPIPERCQRLQHLAIDACNDGTLVRAIPDTRSLYSLVISNISSLNSLPKWPNLPGLKALYIRNCEDLVSLSEEEAPFHGLTSLKLLSIRDCPKLMTLPDEGLPSSLEYLSIGSCRGLKSLGPSEMLQSLTSLRDLYIENCPAVQKLPEEGLSSSLKHLHVEGCPLLTRRCRKVTGPDWSKIKDIPDLEFESIEELH